MHQTVVILDRRIFIGKIDGCVYARKFIEIFLDAGCTSRTSHTRYGQLEPLRLHGMQMYTE